MNELVSQSPEHPGITLRQKLAASEVTEFAAKVGVNRVTMSRLLNGQNGISSQMALSLAETLDTTPEFWLNLQRDYDLWHAREDRREALSVRQHVTEYTKSLSFQSKSRPGRLVRVTRYVSEVTGNKRNQKKVQEHEAGLFE